jgi:hypothetical protein
MLMNLQIEKICRYKILFHIFEYLGQNSQEAFIDLLSLFIEAPISHESFFCYGNKNHKHSGLIIHKMAVPMLGLS